MCSNMWIAVKTTAHRMEIAPCVARAGQETADVCLIGVDSLLKCEQEWFFQPPLFGKQSYYTDMWTHFQEQFIAPLFGIEDMIRFMR